MKQSDFLRALDLYIRSYKVRKHSFKTVEARDSYALLAEASCNSAMVFVISRGLSFLFHEDLFRKDSFRKKDCFECLSPHETAA